MIGMIWLLLFVFVISLGMFVGDCLLLWRNERYERREEENGYHDTEI